MPNYKTLNRNRLAKVSEPVVYMSNKSIGLFPDDYYDNKSWINAFDESWNLKRFHLDDSFKKNIPAYVDEIANSEKDTIIFFQVAKSLGVVATNNLLICFFDEVLNNNISVGTCYINSTEYSDDLIEDQIICKNKIIINDHINLKLQGGKELYNFLSTKLRLMTLTKQKRKYFIRSMPIFELETPPMLCKEHLHREFVDKEKDCILQKHHYAVYIIDFGGLKYIPFEIGRLREETFRAVGEGTGKSLDLDFYDSYYKHLILYDTENHNIVGAYRLGEGNHIYEDYKLHGFYIYSLYEVHNKEKAGEILSKSIELGRSFIIPEYQKKNTTFAVIMDGSKNFFRYQQAIQIFDRDS